MGSLTEPFYLVPITFHMGETEAQKDEQLARDLTAGSEEVSSRPGPSQHWGPVCVFHLLGSLPCLPVRAGPPARP